VRVGSLLCASSGLHLFRSVARLPLLRDPVLCALASRRGCPSRGIGALTHSSTTIVISGSTPCKGFRRNSSPRCGEFARMFLELSRGDSNPRPPPAEAAQYFARGIWSLQNTCKTPYLLIGTFLKVSGDSLGLLHGCCTRVPSGHAHRICIRLHIYAALSPVVIKGTLEVMDSGVPTEPQRGAHLQYAACALT
jgi:hypothetical protein